MNTGTRLVPDSFLESVTDPDYYRWLRLPLENEVDAKRYYSVQDMLLVTLRIKAFERTVQFPSEIAEALAKVTYTIDSKGRYRTHIPCEQSALLRCFLRTV